MKAICGADCNECEMFKSKNCAGCKSTNGCPFGTKCWIAKYVEIGGQDNFKELKKQLVDEFNSLSIDGMPKIEELYPLQGGFINLEYLLPNGKKQKLLNDDEIYLGNQVEFEFSEDNLKKCFGLVANMSFMLVCEYAENGSNPEIILYKRR